MNAKQKIHDLLKHFDTTMLVTMRADGQPGARPMRLLDIDADEHLWLVTPSDTEQARDVANDARVLLVCQDGRGRFLALRGEAAIVDDLPRLRRLWTEGLRVWFPDGPDTPGLRLIDVAPRWAEFWDQSGVNQLKHLWESAKVLAGEPPDPGNAVEHGKSRL